MTLSAMGLALTPAGGSVCMRLKSRISLLRAAVDIAVALSRWFAFLTWVGGRGAAAKWRWMRLMEVVRRRCHRVEVDRRGLRPASSLRSVLLGGVNGVVSMPDVGVDVSVDDCGTQGGVEVEPVRGVSYKA